MGVAENGKMRTMQQNNGNNDDEGEPAAATAQKITHAHPTLSDLSGGTTKVRGSAAKNAFGMLQLLLWCGPLDEW